MVDIPIRIERRPHKPKLNVHAPPFVPSSPPLEESFSTLAIQSTTPVRENGLGNIMSYSAALKNIKPKPKPAVPAPVAAPVIEPVPSEKVKEPTGGQQQAPAPRKNKPSKVIPLGDFLAKLASDQGKNAGSGNQGQSKTNARSVSYVAKPGAIQKEAPKAEKQATAAATVPRGNILDSSVPVLHKGKQRENPKKKYTRMKKAILNERKQHQESQSAQEDSAAENTPKDQPESDDICSPAETPKNSEEEASATNPDPRPPQPLQTTPRASKFRDNVLSAELNERVIAVISKLGRFQDRLYADDPEKARKKKRIVYGLREVHKFLTVEKIKCVILAPNIESATGEGGLDEKITDILDLCRGQNVPYFFALSKMKLGYVSHKHAPVSCAGILNYQGADEQYKAMLECVDQAKEAFKDSGIA